MAAAKVGLALSSGMARGLAHIGVLEVLEREGIHIDMIAGTSIGAIVGALYAQGKTAAQIRDLAIELASKRFTFFFDPALPRSGFIKGRKIESLLKSIIGNVEFAELQLPFACVATDISTGDEVVIRHGPVWKAVRASGTIPVILAVAKWEGRYLVDGGLINPVPVSVLRDMGADFVIAVNVAPGKSIHPAAEPHIFNIMVQLFHIFSREMSRPGLVKSDIIIEPSVEDIHLADFHRAGECIRRGETVAAALIPEIKRGLAAVQRKLADAG